MLRSEWKQENVCSVLRVALEVLAAFGSGARSPDRGLAGRRTRRPEGAPWLQRGRGPAEAECPGRAPRSDRKEVRSGLPAGGALRLAGSGCLVFPVKEKCGTKVNAKQ